MQEQDDGPALFQNEGDEMLLGVDESEWVSGTLVSFHHFLHATGFHHMWCIPDTAFHVFLFPQEYVVH